MLRKLLFSKFVICAILLLVCGSSMYAEGFNFLVEPLLAEKESFTVSLFDDEDEIFELINKERRRYRLGSLGWNDKLAKIARNYSKKMAKESFFSHYDREGKSITDRVLEGKVNGWRKVGENLFYLQGYRDYSSFVVKGWMRSPGHRRNILDQNYTATGIGIAESRSGEIYITQVFMQE